MYLIKIVGLIGRQLADTLATPVGQYVEHYDPDARDGLGEVQTTPDPSRAKRYATQLEATAEWRRVSTVRPLRPDGEPNRPLTAYHVEIITRP